MKQWIYTQGEREHRVVKEGDSVLIKGIPATVYYLGKRVLSIQFKSTLQVTVVNPAEIGVELVETSHVN